MFDNGVQAMPNYLSDNPANHKPIQPSFHRVLNVTTGRVHLGYHVPACSPANSPSSYTGTFRAVNCPDCLALAPEAAWPTPQRETTELGKWVIMDFGFCFVAVCKATAGGWRGVVTPAEGYEDTIKALHCGGKEVVSYRRLFGRIIHYINNGHSWKSATTFNQIGD
jgi:hypothetical protein